MNRILAEIIYYALLDKSMLDTDMAVYNRSEIIHTIEDVINDEEINRVDFS